APLRARLHEWPDARSTASDALRPLLLATLLLVWLGTAYVCSGPGFNWGLSILAEAGIHGPVAAWLVWAGAAGDALLGLGLLSRRWRKHALRAQLVLMLGYSLLITLLLPYYWFDPFAALGKNLVLLVATLWLLWTEPRRGEMPG
ncbi:DoxX-like family protein, partial [Pseudomonas sp.]|uniref:DoxX-like family protein n=1 Tax=Pseudomonas sp. TaxID=306 RepID=UPI0028B261EA